MGVSFAILEDMTEESARGIKSSTRTVIIDEKSASNFAKKTVEHEIRIKHISIKFPFLRDHVKQN